MSITSFQMPTPGESRETQMDEDDREKLQEIHELINLIYAELPHMSPRENED